MSTIETLTQLLRQLEAQVKAIIPVQKRARVASSAPRYRIEGRTKAGHLGPRKARKRVKEDTSTRQTREQRFADITREDTERIENLQSLLLFLLSKREEERALGIVLEVVQLLGPLTGCLDGAVTRRDLQSESMLPPGSMPQACP